MSNSKTKKIMIGLVCVLLVIAGVIWFFVFKTYQTSVGEGLDPPVESTPEPTATPTPEPTLEPTPTPEPFDASRLGNPVGTAMLATEYADALGITKENYPRIDGSTSTFDLVVNIYWNMFHYEDYDAVYNGNGTGEPVAPAKTIPSYKNLIAGNVDLIIVPDPSQAVKDLEKESGVELEYIPIGNEGLIFVTREDNPVSNITLEQVGEIYTDMTITNWSQLGGRDGEILPFCRNDESGSQAQFDNLVLGEGETVNSQIQGKYMLDDMQAMLAAVSGLDPMWRDDEPIGLGDDFPLGYSIYYYLHSFETDGVPFGIAEGIATLSVDGVEATPETITSKEYPLAVSYFAVIRKDTPVDAPARVIANYLTSKEGQHLVDWAGLGSLPKQQGE